MITSGDWLNPTRACGLAAYGTAVTCCAIAWIRTKARGRASRLAAVLALIESALLLDIAFNWRWMLHDLFEGIAWRLHEYEARSLPQSIAIAVLVGLLLLGLLAARRLFRSRAGAFLAVSGASLSVVVWCVEVVSLHGVDHIFYHLVGKWMVVSGLWILACSMTSVGILIDLRHAQPDARSYG